MSVTTTNYTDYFITTRDIARAFSAPKITSTDEYFKIEKVIFNDPATIVFWADGTKTVVKCGEEDVYDYQTGLLMCIAKKAFGNKGKFNDILREWIPEEEWSCPDDFEEVMVSAFDAIKKGLFTFGGNADA